MQRGFLLAEDEALKAKLSDVPVHMQNGQVKRAKTWYRMPGEERERSWPFITLDLIDIVFAADRAHSLQVNEIDYWPSEYPTWQAYADAMGWDYLATEQAAKAMWFRPYDLHYQVVTFSRFAQHDREMLGRLLATKYLPMDGLGYLHVPADDSMRHLRTVDWVPAHTFDAEQKRVFRTMYNVVVTAEMAPEDPFVMGRLLGVHFTLHAQNTDMATEEWDVPVPVP